MTRARLNALLLVMLAVGTALWWHFRERVVDAPEPPQRSDYVLRDFELTTLDEDGKESFTVRGPYLQRDVGGKSLSLVRPRFTFPAAGGGRWNARSDTAWVSPDADEVHLIDKVRMQGPPSAKRSGSRFDTERLVVRPDDETASTDHAVTVTQDDSILRGTGLRANMATKRFQLNQVNSRYAPRRP